MKQSPLGCPCPPKGTNRDSVTPQEWGDMTYDSRPPGSPLGSSWLSSLEPTQRLSLITCGPSRRCPPSPCLSSSGFSHRDQWRPTTTRRSNWVEDFDNLLDDASNNRSGRRLPWRRKRGRKRAPSRPRRRWGGDGSGVTFWPRKSQIKSSIFSQGREPA